MSLWVSRVSYTCRCHHILFPKFLRYVWVSRHAVATSLSVSNIFDPIYCFASSKYSQCRCGFPRLAVFITASLGYLIRLRVGTTRVFVLKIQEGVCRGGHVSDSLNGLNISEAQNMPTPNCVIECKDLPLKKLSFLDRPVSHASPSCSSGRCHIGPDIEDRRKTLDAPSMTLPPPLTPRHFSSLSSFEGSP